MAQYEYKVVAAPERTEKVKGLRTTGERFAHTLGTALNEMAREGWEFLRAETLPCAERGGLLRRVRVSEQHVLVFRRPLSAPQEAPARIEPAPVRAAGPLSPGRGGGHDEPLLSRRSEAGDDAPSRG